MAVSISAGHFQRYFDVRLAKSAALLERIFRIRYDVYCREFGYESEASCPNGLEHDEYDALSQHCLITHKSSGADAGCIRLVTPPANFLLPLERYCEDSLDKESIFHPSRFERTNIAEVSRVAVPANFRRRSGDNTNNDDQRTFPWLSLALFYAAAAMMRLADREHAFVMVEQRLARRMQSMGLPFTQIGEMVDYHGRRAAYYISARNVLDNIPPELYNLYDYIKYSIFTGR